MARYSNELGAILANACRDFGVRLIKSWDATTTLDSPSPTKEEIEEFVGEAIAAFFGVEAVPVVTKAKPKAKAKAPESEPASEPEEDSEPEASTTKKRSKTATKAKPKCQATTAKGTKCTKCAVDDGPFCSVHLKKTTTASSDNEAEKEVPTTTATKKSKGKGKGKGGAGISRGVASSKKKKEDDASKPLEHTHGVDETDEACELCEMHGAAFEVPEYEEDPDYVLEEEDFDEDDE